MRLINRLRNQLFDNNTPGIKTRYSVPFDIEMISRFNSDALETQQEEDLIDRNYRYVSERAGGVLSKTYHRGKYGKSILQKFIDDYPEGIDWANGWAKYMMYPRNPTNSSYDLVIANMFMSMNTLLPFLSPFWFKYWEVEHTDVSEMIEINARNIETLIRNSTDKVLDLAEIAMGPHSGEYVIKFEDLKSHPAMVISGLSVMQAIMARKFTGRNLVHPSAIFVGAIEGGEGRRRIWNKIKDSILSTAMNEEIDIEFRHTYGEHIPSVGEIYQNLSDIFVDILREYTRNTGTFKDRCSKLALSFWRDNNEDHKPLYNMDSFYHILDEEFSWSRGPDVE